MTKKEATYELFDIFLLSLPPNNCCRMKKFHLIYIILLVALVCFFAFKYCSASDKVQEASPEPIDTIPIMVTQIQKCSRLNTAEVIVHKIITHDDQLKLSGKIMGKEVSINLPGGRRKVAIPMYATLKASIDMSKITEDDIIRRGEKIEIILPYPETVITETHIDHDGVKQFVALTRSNFSDEELQNYERQGRKAIEKDIPSLGIEALARESAARQLIPIVEMMGYKESDITITFKENGRNNTIFRKTE